MISTWINLSPSTMIKTTNKNKCNQYKLYSKVNFVYLENKDQSYLKQLECDEEESYFHDNPENDL